PPLLSSRSLPAAAKPSPAALTRKSKSGSCPRDEAVTDWVHRQAGGRLCSIDEDSTKTPRRSILAPYSQVSPTTGGNYPSYQKGRFGRRAKTSRLQSDPHRLRTSAPLSPWKHSTSGRDHRPTR